MITDKQLLFADAQAVTSTAISENVYDTGPLFSGNAGLDIGTGQPVYAFCKVDTATLNDSSGTDATVTVTVETSAAAALTSSTVLATFTAFAHGDGTDTIYYVTLPQGATKLRYIGMRFTVANGPLNAGAFTAGLTLDVPVWAARASAMNFV